MKSKGCLYTVAVPIGNYQDITLRALDVLKSVSGVICEEQREGSTLLKKLGIENELILLNEHNEDAQAMDIVRRLQLGESMALISDHGTPVFADPGHVLVELLSSVDIPIIPVPGPSSLMAALSVVDFKIERFVYGGFLPREEERRRQELMRLRSMDMPVVLLDTPYRLTALLQDVAKVFGGQRRVILACDMTQPKEKIFRGTVEQVQQQAHGKKSEFVLIITGR